VIEPGLLTSNQNNYLVSICMDGPSAGVAFVDISTGEFAVTQISKRDQDHDQVISEELLRIDPAEVLFPESILAPDELPFHWTSLPDWKFELDRCQENLKNHFNVITLDGFGLRGKNEGIRAAGALIDYLNETQGASLKLLTDLSTYSLDDFMTLDIATRRNLELAQTIRSGEVKGSLLGEIDRTITPMGARLIRNWIGKPLLDMERISLRLAQVEAFFKNGMLRAEVQQGLRTFGDLERLTNRILSGFAKPRDLASLRQILSDLPKLRETMMEEIKGALGSIYEQINPCDEVLSLLTSALVDDPPSTLTQIGIFRQGYSSELDGILAATHEAREWINQLEATERERTGVKSLKVGYNKVFGYYIELTKANAHLAPEDYIRKQTLVNSERYITSELKEYETQVLNAEDQIRELERGLFFELCEQVSAYSSHLLKTGRALARLDVVAALAETAALYGYAKPDLDDEDTLEIQAGRHPVVEQSLRATERFVPNSTCFEDGERIRIITGPNMSGKSTYLRQVALIILMAQMGSFVPAEKARIGITDRIFTRIGAQDEIFAGQSTFMVEMVETANILHHATNRSLLILDEIGRGTSTYDGLSIAWAVVEYLHNHPRLRCRTLFATHYHELTKLSEQLPGVRNYNVAVAEEGKQVIFLHTIMPGGADKSYGIHVAELAGLPRPVINRANEILLQLEDQETTEQTKEKLAQQLALFAEDHPLSEELQGLDLNSLSPLEALNLLYEWQQRYGDLG
jgi:DNA mismatch repair protein MutS